MLTWNFDGRLPCFSTEHFVTKLRRCGVLYPLLYLVIVGVSGCSGGFLSTSYENAVAYFNTFYNAKKSFNEATEETRKAQPKTLQSNIFAPLTVPQGTRSKFLSVIEKCSRIIQFHPESSLIDDALFLIGKSYSTMNEVVPARRKFSELLENFPGSEYRLVAKLELAKTEYTALSETEALSVARELIGEASTDEEWDVVAEGLLLEGQVFQDRREYPYAIDAYGRVLALPANDRFLARAAFECAKCYEAKGDVETAGSLYGQVLDHDPEFVLEYQARVKAAIMLAATGNHSKALALLEELRVEQLSADERSRVELEMGNVYRMKGDYGKAFEHYELVDSSYKRTEAAAQGYYQRGLIYEKNLIDFRLARQFYEKAKTEFPQAEVTRSATRKAEIFARYFSHRSDFAKYDSLLRAALEPHPDERPDSIKREAIDSMLSGQIKEGDAKIVNAPAPAERRDSRQPASTAVLDSLREKRAASQFALGVLFFVDLDRPDSAFAWLHSLLSNRPESKNAPQALYVLAELHRAEGRSAALDSIHRILVSRYPDSEYARNVGDHPSGGQASTETDSSGILYEKALRSVDGGNAERALQQLKHIASSGGKAHWRIKAKYTVGWIYENILPNKDSAVVYYRSLLADQPGSPYAQKIRPKLAFFDGAELGKSQPALPDSARKATGSTEEEKKDRIIDPQKKSLVPEETKSSSEQKKDDPQ